MLSFKESIALTEATDEQLEEMLEAMTMSQRLKAARSFKKIKHKVKIGRDKAARRTANAETLQKRARKQARSSVLKKLTKGVDKNELSFAKRQELEKRLEKKKNVIDRIAKKLLPKVRKDERSRKQKKA